MFDELTKRIGTAITPIADGLRAKFGIAKPAAPVTPTAAPSATPVADSLRAKYLNDTPTPALPPSPVRSVYQEAAARSVAGRERVSPFVRNLLETAGLATKTGAQAIDRFVVDQKKVLQEFGEGKYRVTPKDVGDGLAKTGMGALNLTGILAQGLNEGILRIGTSIADSTLPGYKEQRKNLGPSKILESVAGKPEIESYQEIFAGADEWAKEKGATENGAKVFAGFAVLGTLFMDEPGVGSGGKAFLSLGKNAVDQLAKETDEQVIKEIVRKANPNITDQAIEAITPMFRVAVTPEEVNAAIRLVNGSARTAATKVRNSRVLEQGKAEDPIEAFIRERELEADAIPSRIAGREIDESVLPDDLKPAARNLVEGESFNPALLTDIPVKNIKPRPGEKFETLNQDAYEPGRKITDPVMVRYDTETGEYRLTDGANRTSQAIANGDETIPAIVEVYQGGKPVAPREIKKKTPIEVSEVFPSRIPKNAPIDQNLIKSLGTAKNPYDVLNILKNEYPELPNTVIDRLVERFVKTKRIQNVENLIRAARNLNEQFKTGGVRSAAPEPRGGKVPKSTEQILEKTTSPAVRKVMRQDQKMAMIKTLKDKFEDPKAAVAAQDEYNRIWDDLNQKIVDEYESLSMQKGLLEDVLAADDEGLSRVFKKLFMGPNSKNAADDSFMELQEIHSRALKRKKQIENWARGIGKKKPKPLTKTEEYAAELDVWLKESGYDDWRDAQEAIERYAATRTEIKNLGQQLKELKPRVREARILQEGLDDIAIVPSETVQAIDRVATVDNFREYFKDFTGFSGQARDIYRNFEKFFGKKYPEIKKAVLDPFDDAKGRFVDENKRLGDSLENNLVKKFGIRRGSKESAAIQRYGDTDLPEPERRSYEDLVKEFGREKADNIVAADKYFRQMYDTLIDELNAVRRKIYPNTPGKLISKRSNYYRHFGDLTDSWGDALREFFETPSGIDPKLVGLSEFTKAKSRFLSFAQAREGQATKLDAVGGFIDYIPAFAYAKEIDPTISSFRYLRRQLAEAAEKAPFKLNLLNKTEQVLPKNPVDKLKGKGMDNMLQFLDDFTRDLTGNTNPADRYIQRFIGRKNIRLARFINNRMKANSVGGNLGSALAQIANVPAGIADTKLYAAKGMQRAIASIVMENEPMTRSIFLKERYADSLNERFPFQFKDRPVKATGDLVAKQAGWIMRKADELGTKFIWNSEYEKAISNPKKYGDPVRYADDRTRKIVAGRGIGEVPLGQKALATQFVAPFTLEVGNMWWIMRDWLKEKDLTAVATLFLGNYLFNEIAENTRGSRVTFDPINSLIDGTLSLTNEIKEGNPARGGQKFLGRQAGEILANIPFGQQLAAGIPDKTVQDVTKFTTGAPMSKRDIFGSSTAGRFGTPLIVSGLSDAVYRLLPRVGGVQLKKTVDGIVSMIRGHAEDSKGDKSFEIELTPQNVVRALMFGSGATSEAREYYDLRQDLFDRSSRQEAETFIRSANAEKVYADFKKLTAKGQGDKAADLLAKASEDPLMAKAIVQVIKDERAGLGPNDRLIKMLNVNNGERAKFIADQLSKIKSGDDRANYLAELTEKKLLTVEVAKQLALLMGK